MTTIIDLKPTLEAKKKEKAQEALESFLEDESMKIIYGCPVCGGTTFEIHLSGDIECPECHNLVSLEVQE